MLVILRAIPVMYNIAESLNFSLKTSSSAYLTALHKNYISRETTYNSQISDQQPTTVFLMSFYRLKEAEGVDRTLNETLK